MTPLLPTRILRRVNMKKPYQVIGVGNAMVDVLAEVDESFLIENKINKGVMQLTDRDRGAHLCSLIKPSKEVGGGSAANTIASIAEAGVKTAYVGKIKNDKLGKVFAADMNSLGVDYSTPFAPMEHPQDTGRCVVLITPDGERTLNTYLGVTEFLSPNDIDSKKMMNCEWIYLEGYRFDGPESHEAFSKAIAACKENNGKVSLTLSDPFCVQRHKDAFNKVITESVDLLFCNRAELLALYMCEDLFEALNLSSKEVETVACTDGENGAYIINKGELIHVDAKSVKIIDTTGAGDLFAAGFLWGMVNGYDIKTSGRMGCIAGSNMVTQFGARPKDGLIKLFESEALI